MKCGANQVSKEGMPRIKSQTSLTKETTVIDDSLLLFRLRAKLYQVLESVR